MALHPGLLELHRITNTTITEVIQLTSASQVDKIGSIHEIAALGQNFTAQIVIAGQIAFASAYRYVYLVSIGKCSTNHGLNKLDANGPQLAFGVVSIIAAAFLGDISKYMDDHVAVVIE